MQYRLRTLLIVLTIGPPLLAVAIYLFVLWLGQWFDRQWLRELEAS